MAKTIQFSFSDTVFVRMIRALSLYFGYQETIPGEDGIAQIPNPQSRRDFVLQRLRTWMIDTAKTQEINDTVGPVKSAANAQIQSAQVAAVLAAEELDVVVTSGPGAQAQGASK